MVSKYWVVIWNLNKMAEFIIEAVKGSEPPCICATADDSREKPHELRRMQPGQAGAVEDCPFRLILPVPDFSPGDSIRIAVFFV